MLDKISGAIVEGDHDAVTRTSARVRARLQLVDRVGEREHSMMLGKVRQLFVELVNVNVDRSPVACADRVIDEHGDTRRRR